MPNPEKKPGSPEWQAEVRGAQEFLAAWYGEKGSGPLAVHTRVLARAIRAQEGEEIALVGCDAPAENPIGLGAPKPRCSFHINAPENVKKDCRGPHVPLSINLFAGMEDDDADLL